MTPPNITKGEWKLCEETIDGWGGDEVSFSIRDENNELIVCLDMDQRYARFLSSSKLMAEALEKWLLVESEHRENNPCPDLMLRATYRKDAIKATHYALIQAGYTEDSSHS